MAWRKKMCYLLLLSAAGMSLPGVPSASADEGIFDGSFVQPAGRRTASSDAEQTDSTGTYQYTVLEDGIVRIEDYLKNETTVNIPSSLDGKTVTEIGTYAFEGSQIKEIYLPKNLNEIPGSAFFECSRLKKIEVSSENDSYMAVDGILYNKDMTELVAVPNAKE